MNQKVIISPETPVQTQFFTGVKGLPVHLDIHLPMLYNFGCQIRAESGVTPNIGWGAGATCDYSSIDPGNELCIQGILLGGPNNYKKLFGKAVVVNQ